LYTIKINDISLLAGNRLTKTYQWVSPLTAGQRDWRIAISAVSRLRRSPIQSIIRLTVNIIYSSFILRRRSRNHHCLSCIGWRTPAGRYSWHDGGCVTQSDAPGTNGSAPGTPEWRRGAIYHRRKTIRFMNQAI